MLPGSEHVYATVAADGWVFHLYAPAPLSQISECLSTGCTNGYQKENSPSRLLSKLAAHIMKMLVHRLANSVVPRLPTYLV